MKLRRLIFAAAVFGIAAGSAHAADGRLLSRVYNAGEVVVLEGRAGVQATIVFGEDEHIENIAIGDSTSWQVTPNKRANLLFVKPLGQKARTNMTVVTDRHMYVFDLVAGAAASPFYVLRFSYPDDPKTEPKVAGSVTSEEAQAVLSPPKEPEPPKTLNFAWRQKGARRLLPSRVYDDGGATYLSWPANSSIPAILTRNEKGKEGAVNYAVRGDVLVLDTVPKTIVLRAGPYLATLENEGPAPEETASPKTAERSDAGTRQALAAPPQTLP